MKSRNIDMTCAGVASTDKKSNHDKHLACTLTSWIHRAKRDILLALSGQAEIGALCLAQDTDSQKSGCEVAGFYQADSAAGGESVASAGSHIDVVAGAHCGNVAIQ